MPDRAGLELRFSCLRVGMINLLQRIGSLFCLSEDTFGNIPIPVGNRLESGATFVKDVHLVIRIIDEKFDAIELIAAMKIS